MQVLFTYPLQLRHHTVMLSYQTQHRPTSHSSLLQSKVAINLARQLTSALDTLISDSLHCLHIRHTAHFKQTRAVQPTATCRQSPYIQPATITVTSFSLWRALAAPVLIMTSFSLWRHSLLSWPHPTLRTYVTDTLPRLICKDDVNFVHQFFKHNSAYKLPLQVDNN